MSELKKTDHITQESILPRPGEHPCIDCGGNTTGYDALVWLPTLQKRAPIHQICLDAIIQKHFDAARPAEQQQCTVHWGGRLDFHRCGLPQGHSGTHRCQDATRRDIPCEATATNYAQPSAPPQPAAGIICTVPCCTNQRMDGRYCADHMSSARAAEPSVEARQGLHLSASWRVTGSGDWYVDILLNGENFMSAKASDEEQAKDWTNTFDEALASERLSKEQQNG